MKVITAVVNNPIFIEIQHATLKQFMKCEYEFIVFNDAKPFADYSNGGDITLRQKISDTCRQLEVQCIELDNSAHVSNQCAARRCADAMNSMLKFQLTNPDEYLIIDSDMFLISDFDPTEYRNYDAAVLLQERNPAIKYIWNGIGYFNILKLKNTHLMNWNTKPGCDVGGSMEQWLRSYISSFPSTRDLRYSPDEFHRNDIYMIKHLWSCTWDKSELPATVQGIDGLLSFLQEDPRNVNGNFFCEIYDNKFLHYRAGGNWMKQNMSLHNNLAQKLKSILLQGYRDK
jgi:hypothetical protein